VKLPLALRPARRITESPNYHWWVYSAVAVGMFMTVMDQSGLNIALPLIAEHFDADLPTVQWVLLSYVLATSALVMPMGRLSDMVGRKRVLIAGLAVFMSAAIVAGSANWYTLLIMAKVVQAVGAAAIQANGMAMITEAFPERERGKALGMYMTIIGTGSISGPIVGGLLVSGFGWRAVFFAGVPVALVAMAFASVAIRGPLSTAGRTHRLSFDWAGAALSSGALVTFLLAITNAHRLGWGSPAILSGYAGAVVLLSVFVWWERRSDDPMLDMNFFSSRQFSMGASSRGLSFLGNSVVFFMMPFYLVQVMGHPASRAGLLMVPGAICMAVMGPLIGRLSDKLGTRWPAVSGMAMSAAAMLVFSRLDPDSPDSHVVIGMVLSGSGMGAFSSPNTSAIMSSIGRESYGIASAFLNLTRTAANVTGVALATAIVSVTMASMGVEPNLGVVGDEGGARVREAFVEGLRRAFLVAAVFMVAALALSVVRGESDRPEADDGAEG
jgi:EmrB/QacA subfamily drug resistance transporter